MSGIFGLYRRDGRPVAPAELSAMGAMLAHRGPDGCFVWCEGPVGLGVQLAATTPASRLESHPASSADRDVTLVYDGRVDNRTELAATLGIAPAELRTTGDGELMLAAWRRWGRACVERIIGDFAVAIFDRREQQLVLLRDRFGVRPLYSHLSGTLCAFATETKALLALEDIPLDLDEQRIGTFLLRSLPDTESTFYQSIRRVGPAHRLVVGRATADYERYWRLDPTRNVVLGSDREYADAFREHFTEAVRCRVRGDDPVGSLLSGGLDSSSVVCVARDVLREQGRPELHTFSGVFDEVPQCDERPYIEAVAREGGIVPHLVTVDTVSPLLDIDRVLWHMDEPFFTPHISIDWLLHAEAQRTGVNVLLGGLDGDMVVGHGFAYQTELALSGRIRDFVALVHQLAPVFGATPRELYWRRGIKPAVPDPLLRTWHALRRRRLSSTLLNKEFGRRLGFGRLDRGNIRLPIRTARQEHLVSLTWPMISYLLESNNRAAAGHGIETRHPFFDSRLAEFCLALPTDQMIRGGTTRVVMRNALAGILPEHVRARRGKANLSAAFVHKLITHERERLEAFASEPGEVGRYVEARRLRELLADFEQRRGAREGHELWVALMLSLGLESMRDTRAAAVAARRSTEVPV